MNQPAAKPAAKKEEAKQEVAVLSPPRLLYQPALQEQFGVDQKMWRLLCETVFPNANSIEAIALAVRYCHAQGLDIMKRPVHIVPMWNSKLERMVETVWPGISQYRTTASRTGQYGGCDATEFGNPVEKTFEGMVDKWDNGRRAGQEKQSITLVFPEWSRVTVYRIIGGVRCPFPGPKVYFEEIYSRVKNKVEIPNPQWQKSPNGMLEKCAEAAALRKAFPEVGDYTAEEMEGKIIDAAETTILPKVTTQDVQQHVDSHLASVGVADAKPADKPAERKTDDPPAPSEPDPNSDWYAKIDDEIVPGINNCKTVAEISTFINENSELTAPGLPEPVRQKIDNLIGDRIKAISGKK